MEPPGFAAVMMQPNGQLPRLQLGRTMQGRAGCGVFVDTCRHGAASAHRVHHGGSMRICALLVVALGLCLGHPPPAVAQDASPQLSALPFRPAPPLRSYVAIRRLESTNERHSREAWLVARTELRPDGSFVYQVLEEGGSEVIRRRVLHPVLEKESEAHRSGKVRGGGLTHENYEFAPARVSGDVVQVALTPRRKEDMLVKGTITTSPEGELLRVEGELVKRPSFWTRSVHLVRTYGRVDGVHVPLRIDTRAQVRLVGPSTLSMTYEYIEINGQSVREAGNRSPGTLRVLATTKPHVRE